MRIINRPRSIFIVLLAQCACFVACSSSSSSGGTGGAVPTGTGGLGGATGGGSGTSVGTGGSGHLDAGGPDSTMSSGTGAGSGARDGGRDAIVCSPCNVAIGALAATCGGGSGACTQQSSDVTNPDGTMTSIDNTCYANGLKRLSTKTVTPTDGGGSVIRQMGAAILDGKTCYTTDEMTVDSLGHEIGTEVLKDAAGNTVATVKLEVALLDGGVVITETVSCDGQNYEPFQLCAPASAFDAGALGGTGGAGGFNICNLGTCL